jgi:hypothetical protein
LEGPTCPCIRVSPILTSAPEKRTRTRERKREKEREKEKAKARASVKRGRRRRRRRRRKERPRDPCTRPSGSSLGILPAQPDLSKVRFIPRLYLPRALSLSFFLRLPRIPAPPFPIPHPANWPAYVCVCVCPPPHPVKHSCGSRIPRLFRATSPFLPK